MIKHLEDAIKNDHFAGNFSRRQNCFLGADNCQGKLLLTRIIDYHLVCEEHMAQQRLEREEVLCEIGAKEIFTMLVLMRS